MIRSAHPLGLLLLALSSCSGRAVPLLDDAAQAEDGAGVDVYQLDASTTDGIRVTTDRRVYATKQTINLKVINGSGVFASVPGCPTFELERLQGGTWTPGPVSTCIPAHLDLVQFSPGLSYDGLRRPGELPPGTWRAKVRYGLSCKGKGRLEQLSCPTRGTAYSKPFVVRG